MSAPVQVFGRRDDEAIHALMRPATENLGTRHEVAGSWAAAVQRALWGFDVGAGLNGGQDGSTTKPWCVPAGRSRRM